MKGNTFFISDASYCDISKTASIASFCPKRDIRQTIILKDVKSIHHAETSAVLLSIKLAIEYKIKNAVFIYDHSSIQKDLIVKIYEKYFDCIQLLWVKRDLIKPVDKMARDVFNLLVYPTVLNKNTKQKNKNMIVEKFKSYDDSLKIKAALKIATIKEYTVLNTFVKNKFNKKTLHEVKLKDIELLRFVHQVLSLKVKKDFYEYLCLISPKIKNNKKFKELQKHETIYRV